MISIVSVMYRNTHSHSRIEEIQNFPPRMPTQKKRRITTQVHTCE
jgi:hypothetical protein